MVMEMLSDLEKNLLMSPGEEGSELCRILANKYKKWGNKLRGDIILNGIM